MTFRYDLPNPNPEPNPDHVLSQAVRDALSPRPLGPTPAEQLLGTVATTPDQTSPETTDYSPFDVTERAELAVATYKSLGFDAGEPVMESFSQKFQSLHDTLTAERPKADVEPFIGITLTHSFNIKALAVAFDVKQNRGTRYRSDLWDQYSSTELNSRSTIANKPLVNPTDGVQGGYALAMLKGGGHWNEPGLYYTDQKITGSQGQIKAAKNSETIFGGTRAETELLVANPADYIILNAQRREQGLPLLDTATYTRFVQFAMKTALGLSLFPRASSVVGQLNLLATHDNPSSNAGVRLLIGQKP